MLACSASRSAAAISSYLPARGEKYERQHGSGTEYRPLRAIEQCLQHAPGERRVAQRRPLRAGLLQRCLQCRRTSVGVAKRRRRGGSLRERRILRVTVWGTLPQSERF